MNVLQIYLVMQLDSITQLLALCAISLMFVSSVICINYENHDEETKNIKYKKAKKITAAAAILLSICFFIPSTKTAAVMLILPQIANSETIRGEAIELYQLAKDALRETQAP